MRSSDHKPSCNAAARGSGRTTRVPSRPKSGECHPGQTTLFGPNGLPARADRLMPPTGTVLYLPERGARDGTGGMKRRVALQERRRLLRDGLARLLATDAGLDVVGAVTTDGELVDLCENASPDVVVLELDADEWDVDKLIRRLLRQRPAPYLVGLHDGGRPATPLLSDRKRSVSIAVSRFAGWGVLRGAVGAIDKSPEEPRVPQDRSRGRLTPRELQVLELVAAGWRTKEISSHLEISPKTVENHKRRIFTKLGVQNQAHAVSVALRDGFLLPRRAVSGDGS